MLGQLDKGIGAWLSLVGARIKAYDLLKLKLITHYVSSEKVEILKNSIISSSPNSNLKVNNIIDQFSSKPQTEDSVLIDNEELIKKLSYDTIEQIFDECEKLVENEFLNSYEELKHKSPTSLKISLKQIRNASHMSLKMNL